MGSASRLRIGLNLLYLRPGVVGGTETYAKGLIDGFCELGGADQFTVFLNQEAADWPLPPGGQFARVVCRTRAYPQVMRYAYEQFVLPRLVHRAKLDVLHSLGYVGPLISPCATVVTVHDLNYRSSAHAMPLFRRSALALFVGQSVLRADAVIAISHFTRSEIISKMGVAEEKIRVVYLAPRNRTDHPERPECFRAPSAPYFVAFSSRSANKNIGRLIEAYQCARSVHKIRHKLILMGHPPKYVPADLPGVRFTGFISDAAVRSFMIGADALFFPSLYEGFGLPMLEAMQAGLPVASSINAALPEVGGDAALYFDPENVIEMASAFSRLAFDPSLRTGFVKRGRLRVAEFSWRRAASETLDVYRSVARRKN